MGEANFYYFTCLNYIFGLIVSFLYITLLSMAFRSGISVALRAFSTTSASSQLVRAPIQVYGRAGRYAHALYSAAHKENTIDKMEGDLKTIAEQIQKEPDLRSFLTNPSVQRTEKVEVTKALVEKSSVSPLVKNLFVAMAENGALGITDGIIAAFTQIMCAQRKEVVVVVTTAKQLSSSQESKVNAALGKFLKEGQLLKMTKHVDPSLLGGMTVSIGDKFIDMSLAKKIKKYTELIKQPI